MTFCGLVVCCIEMVGNCFAELQILHFGGFRLVLLGRGTDRNHSKAYLDTLFIAMGNGETVFNTCW